MNLRGFQVKTALVIFFLIIGFGLGIRYFYLQNRVLTPVKFAVGTAARSKRCRTEQRERPGTSGHIGPPGAKR